MKKLTKTLSLVAVVAAIALFTGEVITTGDSTADNIIQQGQKVWSELIGDKGNQTAVDVTDYSNTSTEINGLSIPQLSTTTSRSSMKEPIQPKHIFTFLIWTSMVEPVLLIPSSAQRRCRLTKEGHSQVDTHPAGGRQSRLKSKSIEAILLAITLAEMLLTVRKT